MNNYKNYIQKEVIELIRNKMLIVMASVALFFALLDPVVLKMTPHLLKEISGVDMSGAVELSQLAALKNFHGDIFQIFTIVFVVILSRVWVQEITKKTLIIPFCKGLLKQDILFAKAVVYGGITFVVLVLAYCIDYLYAGIIFGFDLAFIDTLISSIFIGVFYIWLCMMVLLISTLVKNFVATVFISLTFAYSGGFIVQLVKIKEFTPFYLLEESSMFHIQWEANFVTAAILTIVYMIITLGVAGYFAKRTELVTY